MRSSEFSLLVPTFCRVGIAREIRFAAQQPSGVDGRRLRRGRRALSDMLRLVFERSKKKIASQPATAHSFQLVDLVALLFETENADGIG